MFPRSHSFTYAHRERYSEHGRAGGYRGNGGTSWYGARGAHIQEVLDHNPVLMPNEIRIDVQPLSIEELSNLWVALETPYRLAVAYQLRL